MFGFKVVRSKKDKNPVAAAASAAHALGGATMIDSIRAGVRNKLLEERFAAVDEIQFGELSEKDGKDVAIETEASTIMRQFFKATLAAGQIGEKYPISAKNFRAYKSLYALYLHYAVKFGNGHALVLQVKEYAWEAFMNMVNRSVKPGDVDVKIVDLPLEFLFGRFGGGNPNWKNRQDDLSG